MVKVDSLILPFKAHQLTVVEQMGTVNNLDTQCERGGPCDPVATKCVCVHTDDNHNAHGFCPGCLLDCPEGGSGGA
jgi:hypothetical protein